MKKKNILDECTESLLKIFSNSTNKYEAHLKSYPILYRMAEDDEVIFEILRRNIKNKKAFTKSNYTPDFQLTLIDRPECFLFVNFFGPNAEGRTDISYSTMHHHDDYLLSTINAKGIGYESLIFQKGYKINKENMTASLDLEKYVRHNLGHIEFIDCHTAHTIFYPESTTMTYGLWSTHFPTKRSSKAKHNRFIQANKNLIKKALNVFNVAPTSIGAQQYREDYFYPEGGKIHFLPAQVAPDYGQHFAQNFFNVAQQFIGFDDKDFCKKFLAKNKDQKDETIWLEKMIENEKIPRNYDSYDMYVPKRNVHINEYKKCYNF